VGRLSHHHVPPSAARDSETIKWLCVRLLSSLPSRLLLSVATVAFELCRFAVVIALHPAFPSHYARIIDPPPLVCYTPNTLYMFLVLTPSSFHLFPFDVRLRQHTDDTDATHVHIRSFMTLSFIPTLNTLTFNIHSESPSLH